MSNSNILPASIKFSTNYTLHLRILFFCSGIPALLYQIVWQRALFRIFGVNIESVTIVVTAFMIGLGIGGYLGGKISNNSRFSPLQLFIGIELLTALFGVFSLSIFSQVESWVNQLSLLYTGVVTLALVIAPTVLMGATLPILINHLIKKNNNVGYSVGALYCVNTLGAAVACFLVIFLLFPLGGMFQAMLVAATINVLIGFGAIYLFKMESGSEQSAEHKAFRDEEIIGLRIPYGISCLFVFLSGFITLSYEILFFRVIAYTTGNAPWAFPLALGEFLLGLALGSYIASNDFKQQRDHRKVAQKILIMLLIANFLGLLFLPSLAHLGAAGWGVLGIALFFVLIIAMLWGGVFPLFAHLGIAADQKTSAKVGLLYLVNILGAATGSLTTGFVLMNVVRINTIATLLVLVGSLTTISLFMLIPWRKQYRFAGIFVSALAIFLTFGWHQQLSSNVLHTLDFKSAYESEPPYRSIVENRNGVITVTVDGTVKGDGRYDGKFNTSLVEDSNMIVRAYALGFYNRSPKKVLMIGLATGSWAKVIINNPEVERMVAVEINPGYVELIRNEPSVNSIFSNEKFELVIDDGRRWLRNHPLGTFDAIIMNTTFHNRANVTNLLSTEFLELIKSHLKAGGTFFYNTTSSLRVQKTACEVYAHGYRFLNHMIVSEAAIDPDFQHWNDVLLRTEIDGSPVLDLSIDSHIEKLAELMAYENDLGDVSKPSASKGLENCAEILDRSGHLSVITDDNMGEEWNYFSRLTDRAGL